ncbi:MAG: DUF4114 domain-containing protein, partial [Flavobacteriaceae bacterium]|nr:DUF4114 domain-containing protein [Flavobacteriaceae bacterium]
RNTLGFYTYDLSSPLTSAPANEDIIIIFPNVSALGSGGGLQTGDKVKIGTFPANTGIGWVLIANAWSASYSTVGYGHWTLFSDPNFNPESDASLRHHNVLLFDSDNERVILGFEDIRRDYNSCDNDFNDAIFYITANPFSAIQINNVADVDSASDVTSSYDGGLESNGNLAQLIAKRNLERSKHGFRKDLKVNQEQLSKVKLVAKNNNTIIDYLPETGMYGTEVAFVSSPDDLVGITNATEVFSVDYYNGDTRVSAVFATVTEGTIYDHSKVICDRLKGSALEDIRVITARGHQLVSSKIIKPSGEIEYGLSFSVKKGDVENELHSYWNIEAYPEGDFYNFQIWACSYSQAFSIVNFIIDTFTSEMPLVSVILDDVIPSVFVKSGSYSNGQVLLDIVNKNAADAIIFNGNISPTETSDAYNMFTNLNLTGEWYESLTIETGVLFDIGFSLESIATNEMDILYLADGPWGLDYLDDYATVTTFNVSNEAMIDEVGVHEINRQVEVKGEVMGNINVFRHLLSGDQTLGVSSYNFLSFTLKTNQDVELVLMSQDQPDWNNRLRYTIPSNNNISTLYEISFDEFVDQNGIPGVVTDIKTIVFSIINDYVNYVPYEMDIKDVALRSESVLEVDEFHVEVTRKLINYPNPFQTLTTIRLPKETEFAEVVVFDLLGRTIFTKRLITTTENKKEIVFEAFGLSSGIYKYAVLDDQKRKYSGTFLVGN